MKFQFGTIVSKMFDDGKEYSGKVISYHDVKRKKNTKSLDIMMQLIMMSDELIGYQNKQAEQ